MNRNPLFKKEIKPGNIFQALSVLMADGIVVIDQKGIIRAFNEAAEHIFGYTRDEIDGEDVKTLMPALDGARHQVFVEKYLKTEKTTVVNQHPRELKAKTKAGEEIAIEISVGELKGQDGRYFISVVRDISTRKKIEEDLRASERHLRSIFEEIDNLIIVLDRDGKIVKFNPACERTSGYAEKDAMGRCVWDFLLPPEDVAPVKNEFQRIVSTKTGGPFKNQWLAKDGAARHIEWSSFVLTDDEGNFTYLVGTGKDETKRVEMEDRLRQAQKMEALGQLTGGIAHDFNNVLTAIIGSLATLEMSSSMSEQDKELLEIALGAARRGGNLTHRLLSFSRKQELEPKPTEVAVLLQDLGKLLPRVLGEHIVLKIADNAKKSVVLTDIGELENCLINLAINARDAMPKGGSLTISTHKITVANGFAETNKIVPGPYVRFDVADTGTGMAPDVLEKVFDPFFTTKGSGKGTGLGLSMVYGFCRQSGGTITVDSEPGKGTVISVYLPLAESIERKKKSKPTCKPGYAHGGKTILLVEDDEHLRKFAVMALKAKQYKVFSAEDGVEAVKLLEKDNKIDLLLTDLVLPNAVGGLEVAKAFEKTFPNGKVIYSSGYTEDSILAREKIPKGKPYLSKPYDLEDLLALIESLYSA